MNRLCFSAYANEGECGSCLLSLVCIEATIQNDGYYDELAEKEDIAWAEHECQIHAVAQAAMASQHTISR